MSKLVTHVGVSYDVSSPSEELEKAKKALKLGSSIVADASLGINAKDTIRLLCSKLKCPVTASPGYYIATGNGGAAIPTDLDKNELLLKIEEIINLGVSMITVHATLCRELMDDLDNCQRKFAFTSRMGGYILEYMRETGHENPFNEFFDDIIELCVEKNIGISLGLALRSPTICNEAGLDDLYRKEILMSKVFVEKCLQNNIDCCLECGGHIPIHKYDEWFNFVKSNLYNVPMRVMITPTDRGMGHDCVSGAIAAAYLAQLGVEMIVPITRAEHISLPQKEDIWEATIYYRLALDCINLNMKKEEQVALGRAQGGCHLPAIFPALVDPSGARIEVNKRIVKNSNFSEDINVNLLSECTMCGPSCPLKKHSQGKKSYYG